MTINTNQIQISDWWSEQLVPDRSRLSNTYDSSTFFKNIPTGSWYSLKHENNPEIEEFQEIVHPIDHIRNDYTFPGYFHENLIVDDFAALLLVCFYLSI